ncbi:4d25f1c3-c0df-41a7-9ea4-2e88fa6da211 [Thermothielavioides terrestris]|uniref:4d25f1c3-c0df-41a7-9ea4-2e88fa6da211 n=1 Tax=Thermothielavioides terrestris TaxID=2587410 RepID=A0A3S4F0W1_9PEZI|nr:4d25f1c3-c0df-41a7-9ea4-2e88fa6da211 [Thermothielavioides terrestris]
MATARKLLALTLGPVLAAARSFDYVIVGGGTAGLVVANRLSENPRVSVAVIEAGGYIEDVVGNLSAVPAYVGQVQAAAGQNLDVGWGFSTVPQTGMNGAVAAYPRAKALGGCSTINELVYSRSSKGAFDLFADRVGDNSWKWDSVLPYYKKSMNFSAPTATRFANATPDYDTSQTARGGPLSIIFPAYAEAWSTWVKEGAEAFGLSPSGGFLDGNLANQSSWFLVTANQATGERATSETAFLEPVKHRRNLFIYTHTMAERILFNNSKAATGVEVSANNGTFNITATKEVILSAGVFQSPQLLMVSGVGPASVLQNHGISVIANLSGVGQNMQDHVITFATFQVKLDNVLDLVSSPEAVTEFNTRAAGPLTNTGGDFGALLKIPPALRANWSDETKQQLAALPADWPEGGFSVLSYNFTPIAGAQPGSAFAAFIPFLQAPKSVGSVSISSASMHDKPVLNPNWLTAQADIDVLVALIKVARQMAASKPMSDIVVQEVMPGPSVQTDEEIAAYIRGASGTMSHPHSTNAMGKRSDPMAVVDSTGKVYGVSNLRVIDASTFPFLLPGSAPQSHIYMLAEKLADAIKASSSY